MDCWRFVGNFSGFVCLFSQETCMFQHLHLLFKIQHFTRINLTSCWAISSYVFYGKLFSSVIIYTFNFTQTMLYVLSIIRWLLVNKISKYWNNRYISILMMQLYIIRKTINLNETIKQPMVATFFNFIFRMSTVSICSPAYAY